MSAQDGRWLIRDLLDASRNANREGFEPFREGIEILRLYGDGDAGPSAALLRYQPGASAPRHTHTGYEHIFVLEGSQRDEHGTYGPGTCVIHAADTQHSVVSDDGCVVLAVWQHPVEFLA